MLGKTDFEVIMDYQQKVVNSVIESVIEAMTKEEKPRKAIRLSWDERDEKNNSKVGEA